VSSPVHRQRRRPFAAGDWHGLPVRQLSGLQCPKVQGALLHAALWFLILARYRSEAATRLTQPALARSTSFWKSFANYESTSPRRPERSRRSDWSLKRLGASLSEFKAIRDRTKGKQGQPTKVPDRQDLFSCPVPCRLLARLRHADCIEPMSLSFRGNPEDICSLRFLLCLTLSGHGAAIHQ
jgi:hypothetical protein